MNARAPKYLVPGLRATPVVLARLLADLTPAQTDARPDPERFTVREVVAHLADWEAVCHARLQRTLQEDSPELPNWDEDEAAVVGRYDQSDIAERLAVFTERRAATVALLEACAPEDWRRTSRRDGSPSDLLGMAAIHLGHDGYHLEQIARAGEPDAPRRVSGA